jgi:Sugar (and other) transporter.
MRPIKLNIFFHFQVLIGEISEPKLRGFFGSTPSASYALGILIVYGMSSMYDWRIVAGLGAILPVTAFIFLCFLPESPTWYINKNRIDEARKSLIWLRGGDREKVRLFILFSIRMFLQEKLTLYVENSTFCDNRIGLKF